MITKFLKAVAAFAALGLSLTAFAQVSVLDFTDGSAPVAAPEGVWSGPDNKGTYMSFQNLSTGEFDGASFTFDLPLNLSGLDSLSLTARSIADQTGIFVTVSLLNADFTTSVSAIFDLSTFNPEVFSTQSVQWTDQSGGAFDPSAVMSVRFSGNDATAFGLLNFDAQRVQAFSSVPEPSTYAAAGAGGLLLLAAFRRRRRQA